MLWPFAVKRNCVAASRTWPIAAGRGLELQREHRLHRVHDHQRRLDAADFLEDALDAGFCQQVERRIADAQAIPARLDLMLGLFTDA